MSDPNWTGRTPRQSRTEYAGCGWVYQSKTHRLMRAIQVVACIAVFALIGVMLGWRG